MGDQAWEFMPRLGIESDGIKVHFGMERETLRILMATQFSPPAKSHYPDEDDFIRTDESTFIRVRYEGLLVRDIEFLGGSLSYKGIDLHAGTTFPEIQTRFGNAGLTFRATKWLGDGQDCPELGINIATHEDVGGDGDGIEWVILSRNFE